MMLNTPTEKLKQILEEERMEFQMMKKDAQKMRRNEKINLHSG